MVQAQPVAHKRKIRNRKRRAAPVFGLWLFLIFCCLLAAYFFLHSAFFSVTKLEVKGNKALAAETVIGQSGLVTGVNIFKADTRTAVEKIVLNPMIKNVEIKRIIPSTLRIIVTERVPVALVVGQDGFIMVDSEAYYLKRVNDLQGLQLPLVSGVPVSSADRPGVGMNPPGLLAALDLIKLMDKTFFDNVAEIKAASPHSLSLKTLQGVEVLFGEPVDLERKMHVIQELLIKNGEVINSQTVEYIDLRYNTAPVIKPRG